MNNSYEVVFSKNQLSFCYFIRKGEQEFGWLSCFPSYSPVFHKWLWAKSLGGKKVSGQYLHPTFPPVAQLY